MKRTAAALVLALSVLSSPAGAGDGEGIRWEDDFQAGLARAAREGRPVLFAINALESERANQHLRESLYPSAAWGRATRAYVSFVANPDTHFSEKGDCAHYGGIPCSTHQDVLRYVVHRFDPVSGALISPQHIVLEPDGAVAYRKEYFTSVVSPELLDSLWVRISPELAYEEAGTARAERIEQFEAEGEESLAEAARTWLRSGDPLAAAGILRAIDFSFDDARRRLLLEALDATPKHQLPVVDLLADEHGLRPDDRPAEALALASALLAADRERGVRLLARIATRTEQRAVREKALNAWLADPEGTAGRRRPNALPPRELARVIEVLLLTGARGAPKVGTKDVPQGTGSRLRRAEAAAGRRPRRHPTLAEAFEDGRPAWIRAALYEAGADEVRRHEADVRAALRDRPEARVRYAAAIAMMGVGMDEGGRVAPLVWEAVNDVVEGPEARAEAVRRLGEDPGWNEDVWIAAAAKAAGGGS